MTESITHKSILFEVVIILGEIINENTLDREPADILVKDALMWFFPEYSIKTLVRWDA